VPNNVFELDIKTPTYRAPRILVEYCSVKFNIDDRLAKDHFMQATIKEKKYITLLIRKPDSSKFISKNEAPAPKTIPIKLEKEKSLLEKYEITKVERA